MGRWQVARHFKGVPGAGITAIVRKVLVMGAPLHPALLVLAALLPGPGSAHVALTFPPARSVASHGFLPPSYTAFVLWYCLPYPSA